MTKKGQPSDLNLLPPLLLSLVQGDLQGPLVCRDLKDFKEQGEKLEKSEHQDFPEPVAHQGPKECLERMVKMGETEKLVRRVRPVHRETQAPQAFQAYQDQRATGVFPELRVKRVILVDLEKGAAMDHLAQLVPQEVRAREEYPEKEALKAKMDPLDNVDLMDNQDQSDRLE